MYHDFITKILENNKTLKIADIFKIAAQIWRKKGEYFLDHNNKLIQVNVNQDKTVMYNKDQVWISVINLDSLVVDIYSGLKYSTTHTTYTYNDIEQCQCYVDKQIIIKKKKGYTLV